jgi:hypothetical protein
MPRFDRKDYIVTFSSSDKAAVREGILFPLRTVNPSYTAGPIRYVTTHLLEKLGYLTPNAFGGQMIHPQVGELFSAAFELFKRGEAAEKGQYPYVGEVESPTGTHTVYISPIRAAGKHTLYLPEDL